MSDRPGDMTVRTILLLHGIEDMRVLTFMSNVRPNDYLFA